MKLILLCGKARAGKDTAGDIIISYYRDKLNACELKFSTYIKFYALNYLGWDGTKSVKSRKLLQELGTDIIRKKIDPLFHINRMIQDIKVLSFYYDLGIITDTRIPLEIEKIRAKFDDVLVIKIERDNYDNMLSEEEKQHTTEIALDDYEECDYVVKNNGSIDDLKDKITKILEVNNND